MKKLIYGLLPGSLLLLGACGLQPADPIGGSYVNHSAGACGIADDTLILQHNSGAHYLIWRRNGYQPIRAGLVLAKKYRREKLEGDYDPQQQVLHETLTGRLLRFDPAQGLLWQRSAVYRKVQPTP